MRNRKSPAGTALMENWHALANAIVLQAVDDYRLSEDPRDLKMLEQFFKSPWFAALTSLDPEYLITELRKEKMKYGREEIS
jgi:hypothetical protein